MLRKPIDKPVPTLSLSDSSSNCSNEADVSEEKLPQSVDVVNHYISSVSKGIIIIIFFYIYCNQDYSFFETELCKHLSFLHVSVIVDLLTIFLYMSLFSEIYEYLLCVWGIKNNVMVGT